MSSNKEPKKTEIGFLESHSLRDLLTQVNRHNVRNPDTPILKEDIVSILKEEDTFIMLYYK